MLMALQIAICLIFLVLAAFWTGKRIGRSRFFKLENEMKALELSFKHLVDDIEMVSSHNIKALDGQCSILKELLTIADKKCLYANDLLKEIDDGVESLRKRNLNPANALASIDQGLDKRFRKEVQDTLEEMLKKVVALDGRVRELEDRLAESPASTGADVLDRDELRNIVGKEVADYLEVLEAGLETFERPSSAKTSKNYLKSGEEILERHSATEKSPEKLVQLRTVGRDAASHTVAVAPSSQTVRALSPIVAAKECKTLPPNEPVILPVVVKKTDLCKEPRPGEVFSGNFRVNEVLRLYSEGFTLPQIARTLNMGKGEIDLILKIYGENASMRNVL